jgi:predicted Zn-dependent protease
MRTRFALVAVVALATGCATNPVTGENELMLVSESDEDDLGKQGDAEVTAQLGIVEEPALQRYVENLGSRLAAVSHRPNMRFTFRILDDPVVNAFALPGGYIYLTRGILPYLQSEGALALVLGHEIGHVTARHHAQRLTRQQLLGLGIGISSLLHERFAFVSGLASAGGQLLMLSYSRDDERQSDQLGATYGARAGWNTTDGADFFTTLGKLTGDRGALPSWASTHPDPGERHDEVRKQSRKAQAEARLPAYTSDGPGYLRRLEGLVFGENPRQGFVEDGWVNHPELRFRFPFPGGWSVRNMASQMQLVSRDGERAVLLTLAKSSDPAAAADAFEAGDGVDVEERTTLTINGFPAVRLVSIIITDRGEEVGVVSTFIAKDGRVFAFHGLVEISDFASTRSLSAIADGFQALTDPRLLAIQPAVLHIVEAPRSATFRELAAEWPIPDGLELDMKGLALMNGRASADEFVVQGTLLKMVRRRSGS